MRVLLFPPFVYENTARLQSDDVDWVGAGVKVVWVAGYLGLEKEGKREKE